MLTVNMLEAKTQLSKLVEAAERGEEVVITRNGRPAVRLTPVTKRDVSRRIGMAKGKFVPPEPSEELDREVAALFGIEQP
jgi:prevent-host-death family protein